MPRVKLTRNFLSGGPPRIGGGLRVLPAKGASDRESANNVYLGPGEFEVSEYDAERIVAGKFGKLVEDD
jgi:hypothetical protein